MALAAKWKNANLRVLGTYRDIEAVERLDVLGVESLHCDLASQESVRTAIKKLQGALKADSPQRIVFASGMLNPIGKFSDNDFSKWRESLDVNFMSQVEILQALLPTARENAKFMFFAGGGTNSAVERYSAYTISKIASIKMCELLAKEYPEKAFFSLGPGWVDTKIHQQTLKAPEDSGQNHLKATEILQSGRAVPMEYVLQTIDKLMNMPNRMVSGRNFSAVHDPIDSDSLQIALETDNELFKLRRMGNDRFEQQR
jgi:NAD(P)-dependent dehydrogenase (short-subunit alcohol dehydrogenase family)